MPKKSQKRAHTTKAETIQRLLTRKSGADLLALQNATGWQPHSVRAAISGLRKAGHTIERMPPTGKGRSACYRITEAPETA